MVSALVIVLACVFGASMSLPSKRRVDRPWPNNQVYYTIDKKVFSEKAMIYWNQVFQAVEENTCINIKERQAEPGYVEIVKQDVENSHASLGYFGPQKHILVIKVDDPTKPGSTYEFDQLFYHEFSHVLGLNHEDFENYDANGQWQSYNWPKAFGVLRELYKCTGTYPRPIPKRPGTVTEPPTPKPTCFDRASDCQDAINRPNAGREFVCNGQSWWATKGMCDKSCGKCSEPGASKAPVVAPAVTKPAAPAVTKPVVPQTTAKPVCADRATDCQAAINRPNAGREFVCNGATSWWAKNGMCDKSCGKC